MQQTDGSVEAFKTDRERRKNHYKHDSERLFSTELHVK